MKVSVMNLQNGDRLQKDTFNDFGLHILRKGADIRPEDVVLLLQHHIDYVEIEPRVDNQIPVKRNSSLDNEKLAEQKIKPRFDFTVHNYQSVFLRALVNGRFNSTMVNNAIQPMVSELSQQKDVVRLLMMLERDDVNNYTHSIQVGLLSFYIASWLGYSEQECYQISKGGYLHDIGKCRVSLRIRHKDEALTPDEWKEYQNHTVYGYDIIRNSMKDETAALIALQHHEREDGTGYPNQLQKQEIHPFAQIVAVADVYVSMRENLNQGKQKKNLITNLKELYALGFGKLNERPVQTLIQHLLPNFIGKRVLLSNGEIGTIVMHNISDVFRPLVKVDTNIYRDLSKNRSIEIEDILMV
ncbi:HD-GYP domain-containing protein [Paenibacillus caui]|uniref:HD-GYP domain-containing protein n=1 Tax=Paenibacillus caui TaxID=2873927 RepID=UPI001CAA3554|nr:HD domain-containing phosphohydrolase [Paenibacillus caui]